MRTKAFAIVVACCVLALGLVACGGTLSSSAASGAAGSASADASSSEMPPENPAFESVYEDKAHEMESTRDSFIEALKKDAQDYSGSAEALNAALDDDLERMKKNLNEIYDSGVKRYGEIGGSDADIQAYTERLAIMRDVCIAAIEQ